MRVLFRWGTLGLTALLAGAVGCGTNSSSSTPARGHASSGTATSSAGQTESAAAPANDAAVTVKPVTWAGYQETIKGLKGKVIVVDFWQTT